MSSMLSIIIPLYNEEENVEPLYRSIKAALLTMGRPYEIICVNDGSEDKTEARLLALAQTDPLLKIVNFQRNLGQTAALMAGFFGFSGDEAGISPQRRRSSERSPVAGFWRMTQSSWEGAPL